MSLPPDTAPPAADHTRRNVGIALGAGALLLLGGYAAAVAAVSGDVPAGTSVRGVDIGGMTTQQAAETLEQELGEQAAAPIPVTAGEATTEIEPAEAGLAVDWVATADQASGVILNPVALWEHLRGNVEVEPITTVDEPALSAAVTALDEVVAVEAVEPQITYPKAKPIAPKLSPGAPGSTLDVPASVDLVSEQYFADPQPTVDLPMTSVPPTVSEKEAASVMSSFAEPAVALPVLVDLEEAKVTASAADIAAALSFTAKDGTLEPSLDAEKLRARMAEDLAPYETRGKDASFSVKGGQPVVIPSRAGTEVDTDELGKAVFAVLPETTADARVAAVTVATSQPEFTTADAKALNITEKLSSFRQWFRKINEKNNKNKTNMAKLTEPLPGGAGKLSLVMFSALASGGGEPPWAGLVATVTATVTAAASAAVGAGRRAMALPEPWARSTAPAREGMTTGWLPLDREEPPCCFGSGGD